MAYIEQARTASPRIRSLVSANSTLRSLSEAGVAYISTRSAGHNHIDVDFARSIGISVEGVVYSPDSVADYTLMLMLMLMAVRNARSIITRAEAHDFRLNDVRGRELRDMTIGVIGTGRIGAAVMDRLRGFGCRVLASDRNPKTSADYVHLDELLRLPVLGEVTPPTAVLIRPDGYVAWVGQGTDHGLTDALTLWFGPGLPAPLTSRHPR